MHKLIYNLHKQIQDAYNISNKKKISVRKSNIQNIVIAGMGGSGIGSDILQALVYNYLTIPVITIKDYTLPSFVNKNTLFFAISYSGDTEETINCFHIAKKIGCPIIAITNGGRLLNQCQKYNINYVKVPGGLPSRAALGYLFIPLLVCLSKIGILPNVEHDTKETIQILYTNRRKYNNQARTFAKQLLKRLPMIYSTSALFTPVAKRWQTQFNENAKIICHSNTFPELDHNEIVGITDNNPFTFLYYLILIDEKTHSRNLLRVDLTIQIIKNKLNKKVLRKFFRYKKIFPDGISDLTRVFSLIMQGDLISYYLARARGIEPGLILPIDDLKQTLASR